MRDSRRWIPGIIAFAAFAVATGCIPSCNIAHVRPERPPNALPKEQANAQAMHPLVSSQVPAQQLVPERWWIDGAPVMQPVPQRFPQFDIFFWDVPWVPPADLDNESPERQPLLAPMPFAEPKP